MFRQLLLFGAAQDQTSGGKGSAGGGRRRGRGWRRAQAAGLDRSSSNAQQRMASSHRDAVEEIRGVTVCAVPASVLDAIRVINPSADVAYLSGFDESALRLYLAHLESSRLPRGRGARWERPGDTRAIRVCRPPEEM